jgi:hypothetical protein
MRCFM